MKEKARFINDISNENKECYLEFFFKLLQEGEKEIFEETHYKTIDDFCIELKKEENGFIKICLYSKEPARIYEMPIPKDRVNFVLSSYSDECLNFEMKISSPRSDLKDQYAGFSPKFLIEDNDYNILVTHQKDKNIISLYDYNVILKNEPRLDIKTIKIKEKGEKIVVDILYMTEWEYVWLSDTIKEFNLNESLLVFDREKFIYLRKFRLSDFLDARTLFLIEVKYI